MGSLMDRHRKGVAKTRYNWFYKCWGRMCFRTMDTLQYRRLVHQGRLTNHRGWARRGIRNEMVDSPNRVERGPSQVVD